MVQSWARRRRQARTLPSSHFSQRILNALPVLGASQPHWTSIERRIFARFAPSAVRLTDASDVTGISEVGESLEKFRIRALE